jgi:hypothetical protein
MSRRSEPTLLLATLAALALTACQQDQPRRNDPGPAPARTVEDPPVAPLVLTPGTVPHQPETPTARPVVHSTVDAGGAPAPKPAVVDAGPGPARILDERKNKDGTCPAGFRPCGAAACRLTCRSSNDCGANATCSGGFCLGAGKLPCD